ncbi:MAG TPA: phospholipid carrier-dependent glycosyltransferase [Candidatus Dormibacteraeota bacterium]|nr:phospholipid carrier-dependent glycosyltransferase [Candidatus Dormibacteraeota bacterium]
MAVEVAGVGAARKAGGDAVTAAVAEAPRPASARLNRLDLKLLVGLVVVAFLLRILSPIFPDFVTNPTSWPPVRAWGLGHPFQAPNGYIFDEVYFAQDACKDLVGKDYYDPEPPLAKLAIAGGIVLGGLWMHYDQGYKHEVTLDASGQEQDNTCVADGTLPGFGTWGWRLTSLFFGTLAVPLMYLLALRLWPSRFFALAAALLVCFDGMFFVQSRIAMIDMVAEFLLLLTYWLFLVHRDAKTDKAWWRTLLLLGGAIGLAAAAKWTTLAALGTIIVFLVGGWALRQLRLRRMAAARSAGEQVVDDSPPIVGARDWLARPIFYVLVLIAMPALIYVVSWFRYNSIPQCSVVSNGVELPQLCTPQNPGPGPALKLTPLTAGPVRVWVPTGLDLGRYIHQIVVHDQWAYDYHAKLTATHPYGSKWFSWPLLLRPVAYYYQDGLGTASVCPSQGPVVNGAVTAPNCTLREEVFNLGNPAIWWFSIPCVAFCVVVAIKERNWKAALIVFALAAAWLPFVRVTRVLFLYHMFGGLPFMILAVAFTLNRMRSWVLRFDFGSLALPRLNGTHIAAGYLGLVLVTFIYFYPLWAALPITGDSWNQRIWFQVPDPVKIPILDPDGTKISWI